MVDLSLYIVFDVGYWREVVCFLLLRLYQIGTFCKVITEQFDFRLCMI